MTSARTFDQANFATDVLASEQPVLVDFWAAWCGPCRQLGPVIDELADEADGYVVGKVDVDANPELAARYGVQSIPTLLVFTGGEVRDRIVGVVPKAALESRLTAVRSA